MAKGKMPAFMMEKFAKGADKKAGAKDAKGAKGMAKGMAPPFAKKAAYKNGGMVKGAKGK